MGITDLFDISKADMSGLLHNSRHAPVSDIIQTVLIEVDEDCPENDTLREAGEMNQMHSTQEQFFNTNLS